MTDRHKRRDLLTRVRFPADGELYERLKSHAEATDTAVNALIVQAVAEYLDRHPDE